jgi:transposase InsO family protein
MAVKTSCRALAMSMATQTGASCAITIPVTVGLLCGVVCCKNHCRDLRHGDDHLLRYLGAAQAVIASQPASFRRRYGTEFIVKKVRDWITAVGAKTAYIEPESPWENGYCESFNGKMRDELLYGEIFYSLWEAQIIIERWRNHYNTKRPHSALGYRPPAPEATIQVDQRPVMH